MLKPQQPTGVPGARERLSEKHQPCPARRYQLTWRRETPATSTQMTVAGQDMFICTNVRTNLQHLEHGSCDIVIQRVVVPELLLKLHRLAQIPGLCQQLEQFQSLVKAWPLPLQAAVTA